MSEHTVADTRDDSAPALPPAAGESSGRPYVLAWLALMVFTLLSFGAHYLPLGRFATAVALLIALVKALVVLVVFMHLRREPMSIRVVAGLNIAWVALLCGGIALDIVTGIGVTSPPASR